MKLLLPSQIHGCWYILPAISVAPTPSYTGHPYRAHLDGGDEVTAFYSLLEVRVDTSPAVRPRYCFMVSTSPQTVSLDLNLSLHPSLGRVSWWFQLVVDGYVCSSKPSQHKPFFPEPKPTRHYPPKLEHQPSAVK